MCTEICLRVTEFQSRERPQRLFNLKAHLTGDETSVQGEMTGQVCCGTEIQTQVFEVKIFIVSYDVPGFLDTLSLVIFNNALRKVCHLYFISKETGLKKVK